MEGAEFREVVYERGEESNVKNNAQTRASEQQKYKWLQMIAAVMLLPLCFFVRAYEVPCRRKQVLRGSFYRVR